MASDILVVIFQAMAWCLFDDRQLLKTTIQWNMNRNTNIHFHENAFNSSGPSDAYMRQ